MSENTFTAGQLVRYEEGAEIVDAVFERIVAHNEDRAWVTKLSDCDNIAIPLGDLEPSPLVLIDKDELASLREDAEKFNRLESAGVDNWEGYTDAMESPAERAERQLKQARNEAINDLLEGLTFEVETPAGREAGYGFGDGAFERVEAVIESQIQAALAAQKEVSE